MKITYEEDKLIIEKEFEKTFGGKYRVTVGYHDMIGRKCEEVRRHYIVDTEDLLRLIDTKHYEYIRIELDN